MAIRHVSKGDWAVESDYSESGYSSIVTAGQTKLVADCRSESCTEEEVEANTRLIAASKKMYQALKAAPKPGPDVRYHHFVRWYNEFALDALCRTVEPKKRDAYRRKINPIPKFL